MAKRRGSRKTGVLGKTKQVANKTLSFLEKGLSGLFGVVKTGVNMGVNSVKKGVRMISSRRNKKSRRNATRRRKY
uniref:Uncharacterized protein n=1 Tax=viral metagenome TaxID=1070528 RepID=A0A6C0LD72_9ZZZZ